MRPSSHFICLRSLLLPTALVMLVAACSGGGGFGSAGIPALSEQKEDHKESKSKAEKNTGEKDSEADKADEPVQVAGAFLCGPVEPSEYTAEPGREPVGCGVFDNTGKKLAGFSVKSVTFNYEGVAEKPLLQPAAATSRYLVWTSLPVGKFAKASIAAELVKQKFEEEDLGGTASPDNGTSIAIEGAWGVVQPGGEILTEESINTTGAEGSADTSSSGGGGENGADDPQPVIDDVARLSPRDGELAADAPYGNRVPISSSGASDEPYLCNNGNFGTPEQGCNNRLKSELAWDSAEFGTGWNSGRLVSETKPASIWFSFDDVTSLAAMRFVATFTEGQRQSGTYKVLFQFSAKRNFDNQDAFADVVFPSDGTTKTIKADNTRQIVTFPRVYNVQYLKVTVFNAEGSYVQFSDMRFFE